MTAAERMNNALVCQIDLTAAPARSTDTRVGAGGAIPASGDNPRVLPMDLDNGVTTIPDAQNRHGGLRSSVRRSSSISVRMRCEPIECLLGELLLDGLA